MIVVLACGSRHWTARQPIEAVLAALHGERHIARLIHGDCQGADRIAGDVAKAMQITVVEYPAQWHKFGPHAGPMRNRQMLVMGRPNAVVAFHDDLPGSRGTRDMVSRAKARGVEIWVVRSDGTRVSY